MKFIHTSDWHIGKTLKGRNRLEEQAQVLTEIVHHAHTHQVDAILIAGDLYEHSAPSAPAQRLVISALQALATQGIEVVVISGNHDHGPTFEAYKPIMDIAGIHVYGEPRAADGGGVHSFTARSTGERVNVAVLPFLSQRHAVKAADIIANTPAQNAGAYDQLVRDVIDNLATGFTDDAVNVIMAHLTCTGGTLGGGERTAQSIMEYHVPPQAFPVSAHYVALGHLHRRQQIPADCPVHYSGSPIAVDFGEQDNPNVICLVEAHPGLPVEVTDLEITAARRLRTVEGTVEELTSRAGEFGDDFLRVRVRQAAYAGLKDDVMEALPNTLEVRIHEDFATTAPSVGLAADAPSRTPHELLSDYMTQAGVDDPRILALFAELHDDLTRQQTA